MATDPLQLLSRRLFVRRLGVVGLGGVASGIASGWLGCNVSPEGFDAGKDAGKDANIDAAANPDAGVRARGDGCLQFLTPLPDFFRQFGGAASVEGWSLPELDAESFALRIEGLVDTPTELRLADLEADTEAQVTVLNTLMCVLGFRSTAIWTGIPLRLLLERAGAQRAQAKRVRFFGADGFENSLPIEEIYAGPDDIFEPLLVFRIYGQRLPRELGFPFRLLLADRYGYKNTKFIQRIEVSADDAVIGQYQAKGYPDDATMEAVAAVTSHRISEMLEAGPVELCGFALSGHGAVESVELALDGGSFEPAELSELSQLRQDFPELDQAVQLGQPERFGFPMRGVWTVWRKRLELVPGEHRIELRVHDSAGQQGESTPLMFRVGG